MDPILQGLDGLTFLLTPEAGIIMSSFARNTEREFTFVYDHSLGYDIGFAAFNPSANYTVAGKTLTPAADLSAAAPGVALVLANLSTGNGVTAGTIFCQGTGINHAEKGFQELNITAFQKPGIEAAP